jgi:predicted DNA-binding transcriptional regulator YafY
MKSTGNKSERLIQLELLLLSHPEGLRRAEIARRLGVHRATAGRYIDDLSARIPLWEQDFRIGIQPSQSSQLEHMGLLEGLSFYLGLRSFAEKALYRFPEGAAAIRKLSSFVKAYSPALGKHLDDLSDTLDVTDREDRPAYWEQLERIGEAWLSTRPVRLEFFNGEKTLILNCLISDIRMNSVSPGILICISLLDDGKNAYRELDLSRIVSVGYAMGRNTVPSKQEK